MPTILKLNGYRFFFYSNEHTPEHIHVEKQNCAAKFSLEPVELVKSKGFNSNEINEIRKLVIVHQQLFKSKWYEYFSNQ